MKRLVTGALRFFGLGTQPASSAPGSEGWLALDDPALDGPMQSHDAPAGSMQALLEGFRARGFAPTAVLDVGANRGKWSRLAKRVFPQADCFLIEPQTEMKPFLDDFCRKNPESRWFLAGAGSAPGELALTVSPDLVGSSFFLGEGAGQQRRVPVLTIDSLIDNRSIEVPQLVKLDIQGFELEALRGGEKLFGEAEVFILEVALARFMGAEPIFHEVVAFMAARGYHAYDFPGFMRLNDGPLGWLDICFVKHDGALRFGSR